MKRVSKTLYEKKGKKYIAVGKDDFILPYGVGDYIVRVRKGSKSVHWFKRKVTVDYAKLEVFMAAAVDAISSAIVEVSELQPKSVPWTKKEIAAWKEYKRIAGHDSLTFSRGSAHDMAMKAVLKLGRKLRTEICPEGCVEVFADREV